MAQLPGRPFCGVPPYTENVFAKCAHFCSCKEFEHVSVFNMKESAITLIKLVAILEHGDTTVFRHLSWTTKLHTVAHTHIIYMYYQSVQCGMDQKHEPRMNLACSTMFTLPTLPEWPWLAWMDAIPSVWLSWLSPLQPCKWYRPQNKY